MTEQETTSLAFALALVVLVAVFVAASIRAQFSPAWGVAYIDHNPHAVAAFLNGAAAAGTETMPFGPVPAARSPIPRI